MSKNMPSLLAIAAEMRAVGHPVGDGRPQGSPKGQDLPAVARPLRPSVGQGVRGRPKAAVRGDEQRGPHPPAQPNARDNAVEDEGHRGVAEVRRPGLRARRGPPPAGPGGRRAGRGVRQVPGHRSRTSSSTNSWGTARIGRRRVPRPSWRTRSGTTTTGRGGSAGKPPPRRGTTSRPRAGRRRRAGPTGRSSSGWCCWPCSSGTGFGRRRTPRPRRRDRPSYTTSGTARTRRTTPTTRLAVTARKTIASHGQPWSESPIPAPAGPPSCPACPPVRGPASVTLSRLAPALVCAAAVSAVAAEPLTNVQVDPPTVRLNRPDARQSLLVSGTRADGRVVDLTRSARLFATDEKLLGTEGNVVRGKADGATTVRVEVNGQAIAVPVQVTGSGTPGGSTSRTTSCRCSAGTAATRPAATARPRGRTGSSCPCSASTPTPTTRPS